MARLNEPPSALAATGSTPPAPGTEGVDTRKCPPRRHHSLSFHPPPAPSPQAMRTKSQPPAPNPATNFEEVKRRFVRQNRDLARNNSQQSLRIRALELEISRLLADNLDLRNQALRLQHDVYVAQRRERGVERWRDEVKRRIRGLSTLVEDGNGGTGIAVPADDGEPDLGDVNVGGKDRALGVMQGKWRERQPLSELMRESRMPTITEDRAVSRRTLGAEEIQAIRLSGHSSTNESPDLGPPPVAHFDCEDPVKPASPLVQKVSTDATDASTDGEQLPANLSVNLETRRKRKNGASSASRLEIRRRSLLPPSESDNDLASSILRTSAKRKLADRETDKPIRPPSKGDFTFSRKTVIGDEAKGEPAATDATTQSEAPKPTRKVLGEKSTNSSPRKATNTTNAGKLDGLYKSDKAPPVSAQAADKEQRPNAIISNRRRRTSSIPLPAPQDDEQGSTAAQSAPEAPTAKGQPQPQSCAPETRASDRLSTLPKTPGAPDLFSPTPSSPASTQPPGRGDTPPPAALTTDSARPSRRARSAVNYAEPSLVAKLRRPEQKMTDAISGLRDPRRGLTRSAVEVKKEPLDDDRNADWVALLEAETTKEKLHRAQNLPVPRRSLNPSAPETPSLLPCGAPVRATPETEEMDIYEFRESSPGAAGSSDGGVGEQEEPGGNAKTRTMTQRRASSMAEADRQHGLGTARGTRRRSMMV